ncbi:endonuclease/exonuclease/phosphatase family protein [Caldimonas tepidiphila]|uniref:endonuclease/exonuclease/phosphatase family protein n=1 Tax=Caldimonas tepidiphila TaxID=2315841 RepID=UPI000E5B38E8|nr:endonuclease/exonuclease/phosphatase family protein [Caldimonas tepidiphila]
MKLMTWNIQWARGADGRVDPARIVAEARRIADFDLLCLQEVSAGYPELPGSDGADQFAAFAALLPGYAAVEGVAVDTLHPGGGRRRFGNMILSRLPVLQVLRHHLPWPADPGVRSMARLALEATVDSPFGPLRVTTTHLEYFSARQRLAQTLRLRELHREAVAQARSARPGSAAEGPFEPVPRGLPCVLAGDFNFRPDAPERGRLLQPFDDGTPRLHDAWELRHGDRAHAPTVGLHDKAQWPGEPFACDFVFVSEDLAPRVRGLSVDDASRASDHQPLLLELG